MKNNQIVVIAGPTATGKTALAVALAKELDGEVVSADSIQIYRGLNIGSAKPDQKEQEGVPHHMLDIAEPDAAFSVAEYVERAEEKIKEILSRDRLPFLVGGTGLYISSLIDNVSFSHTQPDPELRAQLFSLAEQSGAKYLHARLAAVDPEAAERIHPNNVKRVVRALEFYYTAGMTITEQNSRSRSVPSPFAPVMLALGGDRTALYERIDRRVENMFARGLVKEVELLRDSGCTRQMQSMQGIGYKEVFAFLEGECSLDECAELVKRNSRRYAKRQLTWFRRDTRYQWLDCQEPALIARARGIIKQKLG